MQPYITCKLLFELALRRRASNYRMAAGIQSATDAINCLKGKACAGSNVAEKLSDILAEVCACCVAFEQLASSECQHFRAGNAQVLELKPKNPAAVFESVLLSESILTQPAPVDPVKVGKVRQPSALAAASPLRRAGPPAALEPNRFAHLSSGADRYLQPAVAQNPRWSISRVLSSWTTERGTRARAEAQRCRSGFVSTGAARVRAACRSSTCQHALWAQTLCERPYSPLTAVRKRPLKPLLLDCQHWSHGSVGGCLRLG